MIAISMVSLPGENDVIAGKYRIERILGRGGMGVVMAAWHLELDQRVALKFLMPELAERGDSAERFRREARAAARIHSEHVVRVIDVGNWEGNAPYMVMEFLDGRDLAAELRDLGTLAVRDCVDYVLQAIDAVAEAHALGIVHRDLKPENLFLARRVDGSRTVKVLDFGISKTMVLGSSEEQSLTRTANIMGSPFYMSPEQMRTPRNVDARSDIWAIGAILYDLLTGQPPYVADTIPQLCTMLLESDPTPLRDLRPDAEPGLEEVVTKCLAKDVANRWSNVVDLAHALLPFASRASRVHVDRASRVLANKGQGQTRTSILPPSEPPSSEAAVAAGTKVGMGHVTPTQGSNADSAADSSTQDSWGSTDPRHRKTGSPSTGRTWQKAAAAALALMIVLAVVQLLRRSSNADDPRGAPASIVAAPAPAPAASEVALPAGEPEVAPAIPQTATPLASAAPVASARPDGASAAEPVGENAKRAPLRTVAPKPKASAGTGLTDFGGRH